MGVIDEFAKECRHYEDIGIEPMVTRHIIENITDVV